MKGLIVIPCYNEELNIDRVIEDIEKNTEYDYIIIDDCSKDNTYKHCLEKKYNILHLPVNYGLSSGIQVGLKYAVEHGYDAAIQFDGDGQHKAKHIAVLFDTLSNHDIAIGSRFVTEKKPFTTRMLGSRVLSFFIKICTGKSIEDPTSGMRAYSQEVMKEYAYNMNYPPEPDTLVYMLKKGRSIKEVQVDMQEREFGESYLNPLRSLIYMSEMIISILLIQTFRKR